MSAVRPDPDALLARVQREEAKARRGRLTIFFGATAGVGKTFTMLQAAHDRKRKGADVVVGYVEPHGRAETEALLDGLERLPYLQPVYRGRTLRDFDLDAALARKPEMLLVDELAHSNPVEAEPKPRHAKRWQDVEELLTAGIDVYTTVNVQHIESLNDTVAGVTGVRMQETVPDSVFENADEVVLIDTPPDELLERLQAGKVYIPEQAKNAIENFFRKGNLIALREMALRSTADRVDKAMREYRDVKGIRATWAAGERLMVALGPDEQGERLIRATKRLANALHAEWIAVYVETPDLLRLRDDKRNERIALLRLAESLGAETVTLSGRSAGEALAEYARERNVTRVVIGRPRRALWQRLFRPSTYGELLAKTEGIDVHVVGGADEAAALRSPFLARTRAYLGAPPPSGKIRWPGYAWAIAATAICTVAGLWMSPQFELTNIAMVYLLAVALISARYGRGPAVTASILAVASFDFFFVPPLMTFAVSDVQYLITFAIMLVVALLIANLNISVRLQANVAGHRERRTALLYAMTRELAGTRGQEAMARVAVRHVSEVFDGQVVVLLPDGDRRLHYPRGESLPASLRGADLAVAQWVQDHGEPAGFGTDTLPAAGAVYLPLKGSQATLGVVGVLPANPRRVLLPEQFHLLETFAGQIAIALERATLAEQAQSAQVQAETEGLRNALLASISHDLRTPLAVIAGASSSLAERGERLTPEERKALAHSVYEQSRQMGELVGNVLEMTRLEAGAIALNRDWHAIGEIVGAVLRRLEERLGSHPVEVDLPMKLPLVRVDAALIEQVLVNLLENAIKYTPADTRIALRADRREDSLVISVEDSGPGLPQGEPEQLFAKFHRGSTEGSIGGVGLGLAICRAIVHLHGGKIWAERRHERGAAFRFTLPLEEEPRVPAE
ncbi:MAG: sensor histidine kinase KdpD [Betaproteobacteria bacterium]|nr:sensor histidine kinase KdpD [Betaproteobacteria bacterium]MBV9360378.1 sensor histidine kinase KdpD [Betaproteobacteria bacterium]